MNPQPDLTAVGPRLAALTFGDNFILARKLNRSLCKAHSGEQGADFVLAAKFEILVLGKLGRQRNTFAFCRSPSLLAANRCGTLPNPAVAAPVELNFAVQNLVLSTGFLQSISDYDLWLSGF